jgi:hypothetical protein
MDHPGTQGRAKDANDSRNCPISIGLVVAAVSQICAVSFEVVGEKECIYRISGAVNIVCLLVQGKKLTQYQPISTKIQDRPTDAISLETQQNYETLPNPVASESFEYCGQV